MGYSSEVRLLIYGPPDKLAALWTKHYLHNSANLDVSAEQVTRRTAEIHTLRGSIHAGQTYDFIDLHVIDVTWDESLPEVDAWVQLMNDAEEMGCMYDFRRVGEYDGDVERINSDECLDLIYISRPEVQTDFAGLTFTHGDPDHDTTPEG